MMSFGIVQQLLALIADMLILPFVRSDATDVYVRRAGLLPMIGALIAIPTTWLLGYMIQVAIGRLDLNGLKWKLVSICGSVRFICNYLAMIWIEKANRAKVNIVGSV